MQCLYRSDYGAPDPGFDPLAGHSALIAGFEAQKAVLAQAQNRGQLEAMERKLARSQPIVWCDQGYGWTENPAITTFFYVILVALILPWLVLRVLPRLYRRIAPRPARSEITQ
ncbi:MAG TPA: hypothetical protein VE397_16455 [Stellaceae bacterium]|nr:hypothetical protein [Stellaceae bacterium]